MSHTFTLDSRFVACGYPFGFVKEGNQKNTAISFLDCQCPQRDKTACHRALSFELRRSGTFDEEPKRREMAFGLVHEWL